MLVIVSIKTFKKYIIFKKKHHQHFPAFRSINAIISAKERPLSETFKIKKIPDIYFLKSSFKNWK